MNNYGAAILLIVSLSFIGVYTGLCWFLFKQTTSCISKVRKATTTGALININPELANLKMSILTLVISQGFIVVSLISQYHAESTQALLTANNSFLAMQILIIIAIAQATFNMCLFSAVMVGLKMLRKKQQQLINESPLTMKIWKNTKKNCLDLWIESKADTHTLYFHIANTAVQVKEVAEMRGEAAPKARLLLEVIDTMFAEYQPELQKAMEAKRSDWSKGLKANGINNPEDITGLEALPKLNQFVYSILDNKQTHKQ